jgi:hypothetical protein
MYRALHLTWNSPRQHVAAAAVSERPGNAEHSCRILVSGFRETWDILYNAIKVDTVRGRKNPTLRPFYAEEGIPRYPLGGGQVGTKPQWSIR